MKVIAIDSYDTDKVNPVEIDLPNSIVLQKGNEFDLNDVTYKIESMDFKKKDTYLTLKMIRYKISNTTTTIVHKCPARKNQFQKLPPATIDIMKEKYGKKSVESWQRDGRMKMGSRSLANVCPDCLCSFWKEEAQIPEKVIIKGTKLKKRM